MKLFRFLSRRRSAGSWRHQDDTGTVPRKPTSSWAPADRKALARSRLIEWQGFAPNVGGATAPERPKREFNLPQPDVSIIRAPPQGALIVSHSLPAGLR